jgi:hypothetical protein
MLPRLCICRHCLGPPFGCFQSVNPVRNCFYGAFSLEMRDGVAVLLLMVFKTIAGFIRDA